MLQIFPNDMCDSVTSIAQPGLENSPWSTKVSPAILEPYTPERLPVTTEMLDITTGMALNSSSPTYHTVLVFAPDAASSTDVLEAFRTYLEDVIRPVIVLPQGSEVSTVAQADVVVNQGGHAFQGYLAAKGEKKVVVVAYPGFPSRIR